MSDQTKAGGLTKRSYVATVSVYFGDDTIGTPAGTPFECYPQEVADLVAAGIATEASAGASKKSEAANGGISE